MRPLRYLRHQEEQDRHDIFTARALFCGFRLSGWAVLALCGSRDRSPPGVQNTDQEREGGDPARNKIRSCPRVTGNNRF